MQHRACADFFVNDVVLGSIPDTARLARYRRNPSKGPGILFFSGGTALRDVCPCLTTYTHNSVHIITPFDSGGSSAELRKAFAMPAVGDIRNRLMALADTGIQWNHDVFQLFAHRFPQEKWSSQLVEELCELARGVHPLMAGIPEPVRETIRNHFQYFLECMPDSFDLRGASLGNLVLAGGYLANRRRLAPVIGLYSRLVHALGTVLPVVNGDYHLAAELADGRIVVGQHLITGKESAPLSSPVQNIWTVAGLLDADPVESEIPARVAEQIGRADLICYPVGSFYSSLGANLLVRGVGRAVAAQACPKVYVPNPIPDPECPGLSVADLTQRLLHLLRRDAGEDCPAEALLNVILVDSVNGRYPHGLDLNQIQKLGVSVLDCTLLVSDGSGRLDPEAFTATLLSLA
jgi:CofD-related protein of GAK system